MNATLAGVLVNRNHFETISLICFYFNFCSSGHFTKHILPKIVVAIIIPFHVSSGVFPHMLTSVQFKGK